MQLIEPKAYCQALLRDIPKSKKRIVLAAMIIVWGEHTAPILTAIKEAAKRGVEVQILLDNYTRLPILYGLTPRRSRGERLRHTFQLLEEISRLGGDVYYFGKIGVPPQKGRCHVKITVIDDVSYSFGGINFMDQSLTYVDYMLASSDPKIADCLEQLVRRIGTMKPPLLDGEVAVDTHNTILFDGGRPGHSIIYERACELASQAKKIYYVSKTTPSGELTTFMHERDSVYYFNRPQNISAPESWAQSFDQQRYRIPNSYTGKENLHAKYILFELHNGNRAILSGSNNFSYRGVAYGTQEIALQSTDPILWQQLHDFTQKNVNDVNRANEIKRFQRLSKIFSRSLRIRPFGSARAAR
jgi:hypothetical protein